VEVLAMRHRGSATSRAGLDQASMRHQDLARELAIATGEAKRSADLTHHGIERAIEPLPRSTGELATDQRRKQQRQEHAVVHGLVGLLNVCIERAEQAPQQMRS